MWVSDKYGRGGEILPFPIARGKKKGPLRGPTTFLSFLFPSLAQFAKRVPPGGNSEGKNEYIAQKGHGTKANTYVYMFCLETLSKNRSSNFVCSLITAPGGICQKKKCPAFLALFAACLWRPRHVADRQGAITPFHVCTVHRPHIFLGESTCSRCHMGGKKTRDKNLETVCIFFVLTCRPLQTSICDARRTSSQKPT